MKKILVELNLFQEIVFCLLYMKNITPFYLKLFYTHFCQQIIKSNVVFILISVKQFLPKIIK